MCIACQKGRECEVQNLPQRDRKFGKNKDEKTHGRWRENVGQGGEKSERVKAQTIQELRISSTKKIEEDLVKNEDQKHKFKKHPRDFKNYPI